jgi:hypothetical protein
MARKRVAAIGFKAHTGWAAAVIVGETNEGVEILAKRRIAMLDGFDAAAVYHVSHERGLSAVEARPMIDAAFAHAIARAKVGIADLSSATERHAIDRVAILVGADKPLPGLEVILRSHPLVHAAEGEMYRTVLARACEAMQLQVMRIPAIDLARRASAAAHVSEASLLARLAAAGRASGKPWAAEQRECALAAWAALAMA